MRFDVKTAVLALIVGISTPAVAQQDLAVITLERLPVGGGGPAYLLRIDSSGTVSFKRGVPSNRHEEQTSTITADQFHDLVAGFAAIHFFELNDVYSPTVSHGRMTYIGLTLDGKTKNVKHFDIAPPGLDELERTIERTTNVHRWLHGDPKRVTLQSPVAGPFSPGGEDLKHEDYVRYDVYAGIKPGMNRLMQAAGGGAIAAEVREAQRRMERVTDDDAARWTVIAIQRALQQGEDVNAADETGWTALMIAAVARQPQAVSALLDAGARVDQRDQHGDTALIGAAAVRFDHFRVMPGILEILLAHGASVDATNDLGESALMWAARAGNPESINVLLKAGANPARVDQSGHDALFYLRSARDSWAFDQSRVERYNQAESVLEQALNQSR